MVYRDRLKITEAVKELKVLRIKIKEKLPDVTGSAKTELAECDKQAAALENDPQGFGLIDNSLSSVFNILQETDMPATSQSISAAKDSDGAFKILWAKWQEVRKRMKTCLGEK